MPGIGRECGTESFALLQAAEQETCLNSRRGAERRRLDFALEPDEGLVRFDRRHGHMSNMTYCAGGDQSFVSRVRCPGSHTEAELGPQDYRPIRSVTAISMETRTRWRRMPKPRGFVAPTANGVDCSDIDVLAHAAEETDVLHGPSIINENPRDLEPAELDSMQPRQIRRDVNNLARHIRVAADKAGSTSINLASRGRAFGHRRVRRLLRAPAPFTEGGDDDQERARDLRYVRAPHATCDQRIN
jgi:hypothetical protein